MFVIAKKLKTTQISSKGKLINNYGIPFNEILLSNAKELTTDTSNNLEESPYILNERSQIRNKDDSLYIKFLKIQTNQKDKMQISSCMVMGWEEYKEMQQDFWRK